MLYVNPQIKIRKRNDMQYIFYLFMIVMVSLIYFRLGELKK